MLVEERFRRVTVVTDITHERLGIGVLQHVRLVLGGDLEGLATRVACIRGGVAGFNMLVQHRQARIEIVTEATAKVAPLLHVNARDVAEQSRAEWEDFAAVLAGQILRWQMRLHVDLQRNLVVITLPAVGTAIRSHALVNVIVLGQVELGFESLGTLGTLYGPRIGVRAPDVLHHVGLANELGIADDARILLDTEVRLHVNRTLVAALVELSAELARVTVLRPINNLLHVVVHLDLLAVDLKEVLRILRGFQPLLQLRQIFQLRHRAAVLR